VSDEGAAAVEETSADPGPGGASGSAWWRLVGLLVAGQVVAGVVLGGVWSGIAPRPTVRVSGGEARFVTADDRAFLGAEMTFLFLAVAAGVVTVAVGWFLARRRDVGGRPVLAAVVLGGLLGAVLAWRTGEWLSATTAAVTAASPEGTVGAGALDLRATAYLLGWPLAGAVTVLLASLFVPFPADVPAPNHDHLPGPPADWATPPGDVTL
jgi:hypothetical protein